VSGARLSGGRDNDIVARVNAALIPRIVKRGSVIGGGRGATIGGFATGEKSAFREADEGKEEDVLFHITFPLS
jgi:hypothetical protein